LEELTSSSKNDLYIDSLVEALKEDIDCYPQQIAKFLSCCKHMGLSVSETKTLRSDADAMKVELDKAIDYKVDSCANTDSSCSIKEKEGRRSRAVSSAGYSLNKSGAEEEPEGESSELTSSEANSTERSERELVDKIVKGEDLNNEDFVIKKQLLNELRIPENDVAISRIRIGQGGFGEVYLGTLRRKYKVAIKSIKNCLDDPYADKKRKTIENELLLMKSFGSFPTIVTCYGYIMKEDSLQIVLELAPYGSLDAMLRDNKNFPSSSFPLSLSLAWLCDLADAIKFLHSRGIKHRDIKAENMLVFERFRIKLCDFGPAKQHLANITAESKVGTFCFMAPEIRIGHVSELSR
jgi:hypothetical protein